SPCLLVWERKGSARPAHVLLEQRLGGVGAAGLSGRLLGLLVLLLLGGLPLGGGDVEVHHRAPLGHLAAEAGPALAVVLERQQHRRHRILVAGAFVLGGLGHRLLLGGRGRRGGGLGAGLGGGLGRRLRRRHRRPAGE